MNEQQKLEYLISMIDKANQKGAFTLQESTNLGIILRDLSTELQAKLKAQNEAKPAPKMAAVKEPKAKK